MMESYQAFGDVADVIELTETLVVNAARRCRLDGDRHRRHAGRPRRAVAAATHVRRRVGRRVAKRAPDDPVGTVRSIAETHGVRWEPSGVPAS